MQVKLAQVVVSSADSNDNNARGASQDLQTVQLSRNVRANVAHSGHKSIIASPQHNSSHQQRMRQNNFIDID